MNNTCKICNQKSTLLFKGRVLDKYIVDYFRCNSCGFIQTEHPYWLGEAYQHPINLMDTGLTRRNILAAKSVSTLLFFLFDKNAKYLDYAGGYGMFTRLMRNIGFDFYSYDPYTENLLARGFDYDGRSPMALVTSFESFEHFEQPLAEIEKMLSISNNLFFSTQLVPWPVPPLESWWYYGAEHGQHIAFYTPEALRVIAARYHLHVYSLKGYHLLTEKKIHPLYFKWLVGAGRYGLYKLPDLLLWSKVMTDMQQLGVPPVM